MLRCSLDINRKRVRPAGRKIPVYLLSNASPATKPAASQQYHLPPLTALNASRSVNDQKKSRGTSGVLFILSIVIKGAVIRRVIARFTASVARIGFIKRYVNRIVNAVIIKSAI